MIDPRFYPVAIARAEPGRGGKIGFYFLFLEDRTVTNNRTRRLGLALGLSVTVLAAVASSSTSLSAGQTPAAPGANVTSFYDFKINTLEGKPADLGMYKGKVSLVVNVASKCGYTPQYEGLEKLQKEKGGKDFNVLGFPSNDFGGQEPGTAAEIVTFCKLTYGVTFPMFEKVVTKAGPEQSPVYSFLGASGNLPAWNFSKYVVGKDGKIVAFFPSKVTPESPELLAAIDKALAAK
jgi:glutathione peroxidase